MIVRCILFFFLYVVVFPFAPKETEGLEITYKGELKEWKIDEDGFIDEFVAYQKRHYKQTKASVLRRRLILVLNKKMYHVRSVSVLEGEDYTASSSSFLGVSDPVYVKDGIAQRESEGYTEAVTYHLEQMLTWEITQETKVIQGYLCYKALATVVNERMKEVKTEPPVMAWFTTELGFSGGPTIFGHLPGVILELETALAKVEVESIKKTEEVIRIPTFKSTRTFDEVSAYYEKMHEGRYERMMRKYKKK